MAEKLIRESDVIKLIDEWLDNYPLPRHVEKGLQSHKELLAYIADAPTIKAKPVVHAHWEKMSPEKGVLAGATCSNCKVCAGYWDETMEEFDFCPYCGAQMDELVSNTDELKCSEKPNSSVKIPVMSMKDICRKIMCDR